MLDVVDLFREQGTVDDLGVGAIRDTFADLMFPGTSTLHTRLRYVLFIPWLLQRAAQKPTPEAMAAELQRSEYRLITSLIAGGEEEGVLGNRAQASLKTLPSRVYWGGIRTWGLVTVPSSTAFFRRAHDSRALARRAAHAEDIEGYERTSDTGVDPHLPPAPGDLLTAVDFTLTPAEEQYLSDRITASGAGSLLAWLVHHETPDLPPYPWLLPHLHQAPAPIRVVADHARRFHTAIHGAPALYNLMLAELTGQAERVEHYRDAINNWREELHATTALDGWSRPDFWDTVYRQQPQLRPPTRRFIDTWLDLVSASSDIVDNSAARRLVAERERLIKGPRARLANAAARDRWNGASGMGRLNYRWAYAARHLNDLYAARRSA